ncbi:hypothetical protein BHE74_00033882 [Ensete ventricosum]|nr:hypothetical protein BHE74_00033882 [Ensete ventricosum]RZR79609.1 hypothetical protein BHM03_00005356 [Ensete ventricosum]
MERSTKVVLLLHALLLATYVVCLEGGRSIPSKPKAYKPQNFFGYGGFYGSPLGPHFGFGTIPIIGSIPGTPAAAGLRGRQVARP